MATGALIGGSVIGLIGKKKSQKAGKKAANAQYKAVVGAVERSREVEEKRTAAENIADAALEQANKAFRGANAQKYANAQIGSAEWGAANAERRVLQMANIELGAQERAEQVRRQERGNEITEGRAGTRASASGFGGGSSLDSWVDTMVSTHASDVAWMVSAGESADRLATMDVDLQFKNAERERAAMDRDSLLGYQTGEAQYDFYESQREADSVMREADRFQRESDRQYALETGDASRVGQIEQGKAGWLGAIGGAVSGIGGIQSSYNKFGWGF
jgi:hypothetical protein